MLSAVESFGPAVQVPSAAALHHPYATHHHHHQHHHNPYAIAAAAAAAGSAAAAAAAVIPQAPLTPTTPTHPQSLQQSQQQQQQQQQHFHQQQQHFLQQHPPHLGFFLPPPAPPTSLALLSPPATSPTSLSVIATTASSSSGNNQLPVTSLVLTSKCSPLQLTAADYQQHQQQQQLLVQQQQFNQQHNSLSPTSSASNSERSPRRSTLKLQQHQQQKQSQQQHEETEVMSSAEFARPHPKQPRYNNNNSSSLNGIGLGIHKNSIPLHQRSPTGGIPSSNSKLSSGIKSSLNNNDKLLNFNHPNHNNNNNTLKNGYAASCVTPPTSKYSSDQQCGPVNLVTNHNHNNNNSVRLSNTPPEGPSRSSSSSSVDVENDGSMSPITIPATSSSPARKTSELPSSLVFGGGGGSAGAQKLPYDPAAAAAVAAAYQFNFPHLYASPAALYNPTATAGLFSGHHHALAVRPHASYLSHGATQAANDAAAASNFPAYLQAMQNAAAAAAAGIYQSPAPQPSPPSASSTGIGSGGKSMMRTPTGSMLALAPPSAAHPQTSSGGSLSNGHNISTLSMTTPNDLRQQRHLTLPPQHQQQQQHQQLQCTSTTVNGTYLNGKVNSTSSEADGGSYFKVPSGKEGSLKHRILTRPASSQSSNLSHAEKLEARNASITAAVVRTNNATTNFTKGAYIELANGVLRRVEDMRTEDFIQCAERSPHHQLAESTVVKINAAPGHNVVITFSYDKNRSKADVEVTPEHPFFVYGQGWASYNPELSHKSFGLKCQRLQVGDICISLTSRDPVPTPSPPTISNNHQQPQMQSQLQPLKTHTHKSQISPSNMLSHMSATLDKIINVDASPQNLSRKLHPATLHPDSRQVNAPPINNRTIVAGGGGGYPLHHSMQLLMMPSHLAATTVHHSYADMTDLNAAYAAENAQISRGEIGGIAAASNVSPSVTATTALHHLSSPSNYYHHQHSQHQHQQQQHTFHNNAIRLVCPPHTTTTTAISSAPIPIHMTTAVSAHQHNLHHNHHLHHHHHHQQQQQQQHHQQPYYESPPSSTDGDPRRNHSGSSGSSVGGGVCDDEQDQPVDATMQSSRKRRWSAPESICDDDDVECQRPPPTTVGGVANFSGYKAYITTATAAAVTNPTV